MKDVVLEPDHSDPVLCPADDLKSLTSTICQTTVDACRQRFPDCGICVILTGSMARNEATFVRTGKSWTALSDADFLVIFPRGGPVPSAQQIQTVRRTIETGLGKHDIECSVTLAAVRLAFLRELKPHVFAYELRAHGRVVHGDPGILSLIPEFTADDIPLEDGWRLLANRMVELLEVSTQLEDHPAILPLEVYYRTSKLCRDMATSFLLFQGNYQTTYAARAVTIQRLANCAAEVGECEDFPRRIPARLTTAMLCKLSEASREHSNCLADRSLFYWREAIEQASQLWRWELERLTLGGTDRTPKELMTMWMAQQPAAERLRGWGFTLRECSTAESVRNGFRWARLALRGSPRYYVYAGAAELLFRMPALLDSEQLGYVNSLDPDELRAGLPIHGGARVHATWSELVSEVSLNYHRFLESTRV